MPAPKTLAHSSDQRFEWRKRKKKLPAVRVQRLEESHSCRDVQVSVSVLAVAPGADFSAVTRRIGLDLRAHVHGLARGCVSRSSAVM